MSTQITQKSLLTEDIPEDMLALKESIEEQDGVITITMEKLRDTYGKRRLGSNIVEEIESLLTKMGIAHQPSSLPNNQNSAVRLYIKKSPVGRLIRAATFYGNESHNVILRKSASQKTADTLSKVRELVEKLGEVVEDEDE